LKKKELTKTRFFHMLYSASTRPLHSVFSRDPDFEKHYAM